MLLDVAYVEGTLLGRGRGDAGSAMLANASTGRLIIGTLVKLRPGTMGSSLLLRVPA